MNGYGDVFDPYHKWLGIAPSQQPPHHYRLLGIELFEDDAEVIAAAADRQMAHVRTFQSGPHAAWSQRILNELAAARLCLLDPVRKREYDAKLRQQLAAETQQTVATADTPASTALPGQTGGWGIGPPWLRLVPAALGYLRLEFRRLWLQHSRLPALYWQVGLLQYQAGRHDSRCDPHHPPPPDMLIGTDRLPTRRRQSLWRTLGYLWRAGWEHRRRALALVRLGREAYALRGPDSAPPAIADALRSALGRLSEVQGELDRLSQVPPGHVLSPRRLAWMMMVGLGGVAMVCWSWIRPW